MLNWDDLADNRDFRNPQKTPEGIQYVIVNGQIACDNGKYTGVKAGMVIRKKRSV